MGGGGRVAERVVSLVPSMTEAMASVRPAALVGVTDWCTRPPDLQGRGAQRVRGTKNPNVPAIVALDPDVVVVNKEENRQLDVRRMRDAGLRVWVSQIETLPQAFAAYDQLFDVVLRWPRPDWLERARTLWSRVPPVGGCVVVPIWRDPWMVVGSRTFAGDVLRRLGWRNVFCDHPERYPHVPIRDIDEAGADVALLPDEPYVFGPGDGPEAFTRTRVQLVSGRLLTWYGPSLIEAWEALPRP